MTFDQIYHLLGLTVVACPTLLLLVLGLSSIPDRGLSEHAISRITQWLVTTGLIAAVLILGIMLAKGDYTVPINLGNWVAVPEEHGSAVAHGSSHDGVEGAAAVEHMHFELKFVFDRLSVPFVILSFVLCGTIGAFAKVYMHKEGGYRRFFVLYAVFLLGMVVSGLAGSIETLFAGWELVGLSSALLVAFYHERVNPVKNGLRVWTIYRIADAAFLVAAIYLHHRTGAGDFAGLMGHGDWPLGTASMTSGQALLVGSLLLVAAAGKSAMVPFSGWLPRAMEGPTPSSAIFYGALSVHLGAYLLLRCSSILEKAPMLAVAVVLLGLVSAFYGATVGQAQTDIKSALSFASMTQVSIIVVEIGAGSLAPEPWRVSLRYMALAHLLGHACLRTLQLLRAPSLLMDYHRIENALGQRRAQLDSANASGGTSFYRFAFERGHLDQLLDRYVIGTFMFVFSACDRWERSWTDFLSGTSSRESDEVTLHPEEEGVV